MSVMKIFFTAKKLWQQAPSENFKLFSANTEDFDARGVIQILTVLRR
jgi:hypothetical protein